jgi:hypothetical protein
MNARYHSAREGFLNGVHRWLMFGIIVIGAGSVVDIVSANVPLKGDILFDKPNANASMRS